MVNNYFCLTASRGFIGSYVKKKLVKSGYNVKSLSNNGVNQNRERGSKNSPKSTVREFLKSI